MVLGSTQSLTEMSTFNILGRRGGRPARKADLTAIWSRLSRKYESLDVSQTYELPQPFTGIALRFYLTHKHRTHGRIDEGTTQNLNLRTEAQQFHQQI
jgi:hypothetical protein